jgi:hypothetical protein
MIRRLVELGLKVKPAAKPVATRSEAARSGARRKDNRGDD